MLRTFTAPHHYIQGPGALQSIANLLDLRHERVFILIDPLVEGVVAPSLRASLDAHAARYELISTAGEVTEARIGELTERARPLTPTVVIAAGGGKTLDTGKGVARALGCRVVTVPTIASNDGPTSRTVATYDEQHRLVATPQMTDNPYAVVVDTTLIANAPAIFLLSGIGDALAKRFEADACSRGAGVTSNGTRPLVLPLAIAASCYDVLLTHAEAALADNRRRRASPALEKVIEAVVLMSGLAFENGGLSLAHSMTRGLMRIPGAQDKPHGLHVAYGLLVQLMHERQTPAYATTRAFHQRIGLPVQLADLGVADASAITAELIEATLVAPHMPNCVPVPSERSLAEAIARVESGDAV